MILQELEKLYGRLAADPTYGLPTPGYSTQKVSFVVVLRPDGTLHSIEDARQMEGKKKLARNLLLPGQAKPSGQGINPCLLWDNTTYLFGYKAPDPKKDPAAEAERQSKCFAGSVAAHTQLAQDCPTPETRAIASFLQNWKPADIALDQKAFLDDAAATGFGVFRLQGETRYLHETPAIKSWWDGQQSAAATASATATGDMCLITGQLAPAATLHEPAIKGAGGQSSGTKVVSYNCASFTSYAKDQGANAPVSEAAAFRYCNALNTLLAHSKHRLRLGDMTVVFWTDAPADTPSATEDIFADLFDGKIGKDAPVQDAARVAKLASFWKLVQDGAGSGEAWTRFGDAPGTKFFMLGLSPNAARLSVRFWQTGTLGEFATRLKEHTDAMAMVRAYDSDREHPPLWLLLAQTARDSDGIPPLLGGALLRAVLSGAPYPTSMAQLVLNRIRADHKIDHLRAGFLKAYLTRQATSLSQPLTLPLPMSLDTSRTEAGYLLGRLFSALEKTQGDALGAVNAGLRDRYYGAASATPRAVFPRILRTYQHHLGKLHGGQRVNREKLVQEIVDTLRDFPAHLNLAGQGLFALGYYHQNTAFYTKKETAAEAATA